MKVLNKLKTKMSMFTMVGMLSAFTIMVSCNTDDGPAILTVVSITGTGTDFQTGAQTEVDLNSATLPTDVPLDLVIVVTFDREVDAATATSSNFTLTGDDAITITVSASGAAVTITPGDDLPRGTDYTMSVGAVLASDGGVFEATTRSFKTAGIKEVDPPQATSMVAYWNFDGDAEDQVGNNDPSAVVEIDFQEDRHGQPNSAAYFDGDASIIEIPAGSSLINTSDFTLSFWIKTQTEGHVNADGNPTGMFVMGLGAFFGIQYEIFGSFDGSKFAISYENDAGDTFSEDMWFPNGATDANSGGWQGWSFAKNLTAEQMQDIIKDKWYHVIYTFDGAERTGTLYFNGELMKSFDFDLWPDGADKQTGAALKYRGAEPDVLDELAFGFIHSRGGTMWDQEPWGGYEFPTANHFKGWLDDIRIFHTAFSADDASSLYNDESN